MNGGFPDHDDEQPAPVETDENGNPVEPKTDETVEPKTDEAA